MRRLGRAKALAKRAAVHLTHDRILNHAQLALPDGGVLLQGERIPSDLAVRFSALDELSDLLSDPDAVEGYVV